VITDRRMPHLDGIELFQSDMATGLQLVLDIRVVDRRRNQSWQTKCCFHDHHCDQQLPGACTNLRTDDPSVEQVLELVYQHEEYERADRGEERLVEAKYHDHSVSNYMLHEESRMVDAVFQINGYNFAGRGQNQGMLFVHFKDWSERTSADLSVQALIGRIAARFASYDALSRARRRARDHGSVGTRAPGLVTLLLESELHTTALNSSFRVGSDVGIGSLATRATSTRTAMASGKGGCV
jgi:AcrB/AcrD/AcrF family